MTVKTHKICNKFKTNKSINLKFSLMTFPPPVFLHGYFLFNTKKHNLLLGEQKCNSIWQGDSNLYRFNTTTNYNFEWMNKPLFYKRICTC